LHKILVSWELFMHVYIYIYYRYIITYIPHKTSVVFALIHNMKSDPPSIIGLIQPYSLVKYSHAGLLVKLRGLQTCQVSRFNRETHDFWCFLTISRLSPQISRFSEFMKSSKSATSSYNKAHSSKLMLNVQRQNFVCVMFVLQSKKRVLLSLLFC
jgi:hypothetical protein